IDIMGNACPQGADYAKEEVVSPTRILPTTAKVKNGTLPLVPVKTTKAIPLEVIHDAMAVIGKLEVEAPIKIGDVLIENILDTGADIVATRNLNTKIQ
ncbi:MAG: DUF1667 domain-containing protein, partial [bacterium]